MKTIGQKLEQILDDNDMRASDMRIDLHVAPATLSSWMHDTRTPGAYHIKRICEKYNVSADWLLGIGEKDENTTNRKRAKSI